MNPAIPFRNAIDKKADLTYLPWAAFLLLVPFYFWRSGLPQVSDILMAVFMAWLFVIYRLNARFEAISKPLLIFVFYTAIVNLIWTFLTDEPPKGFRPYHYTLFYIYNYLLFLSCLTLFRKNPDRYFLWTAYAIGTSLVIQALLTTVRGGASRNEGFFNNPNQFGYYALLSATIFAISAQRSQVNPAFQSAVLVSAVYIAALSLSKAALGGILLLFCFFTVQKGYFKIRQLVALAIAGSVLLFLFSKTEHGQSVTANVQLRLEKLGADDSVEGRGYGRIVDFPQYLLVGAGEGALYRFATGDHEMEIHSSLGTIFFSYGIVGLAIFTWFMYQIFALTGLRLFLFILPALAYGVTHMGLRFTSFWVMLATICAASEFAQNKTDLPSTGEGVPPPWKKKRQLKGASESLPANLNGHSLEETSSLASSAKDTAANTNSAFPWSKKNTNRPQPSKNQVIGETRNMPWKKESNKNS